MITNEARRRIGAAFIITPALALLVTIAVAAAPSPEGQMPDPAPAMQGTRAGVTLPADGLRDEAAMVLVGSALIGLAAVVRRAA
jgi:hypothetical protein